MRLAVRIFGLTVVACALCVETAAADPPSTAHTGGRFLLSVPFELLSVRYYRSENEVMFGNSEGVSFRLTGSPWLRGVVGYGISDDWLVDIELQFSYDRTQQDDSDEVAFRVGPGLSYVFSPGQRARPFIGVRAFFGRDDRDIQTNTDVGVAAILGIQLHVAESLSIDPFLQLSYGGAFIEYASDSNSFEYWTHSVDLQGGFAVSVWL